jgi:FKBP-type peptidyl-prolyl cis-trans isomerase
MRILTLLMLNLLLACDGTTAVEEHDDDDHAHEDAHPVPDTVESLPAPSDVTAAPADAQKTPSGLAYKILKPGEGDAMPSSYSEVEVHYTGWTTDGEMFDSSVTRGEPASFPLGRVIPGWTEGLQLMKKGEKTRFWIPEELAYKGRPGAPAGMLVFDVELLSFTTPPAPPPAPADVAGPPANASKTASGLAYVVLNKGPGGASPEAADKVDVNYTGWTTDGEMFDSSIPREKPATFGVNRVIPGWTEGLQLMQEGDSYRFWIPTEIAYNGAQGKPAGMLVFDVELLKVTATPKPPETPSNVSAPPASATKTESGLAYVVISKGSGGAAPAVTDRVKVNYTGWTTDGEMFDSSVPRGRPATFPLNRVIAGWTEGLQLMSPGDSYRFWIPKELAYNDAPGKPAGMLVFDVELLEVVGQ